MTRTPIFQLKEERKKEKKKNFSDVLESRIEPWNSGLWVPWDC